MAMREVDPEKIEAVLSYLQQNFSNHTFATSPDPDNPTQQEYRIHWKGDGSLAHRFAVRMEFFDATDVQNIPTKLTAYNFAHELHNVGRTKLVVTTEGIQRQGVENLSPDY